MTVTGTVISKTKNQNPIRVDVLLKDTNGTYYCFQVRPKNIIKLIDIDTGNTVRVTYFNTVSNGINYLILENIEQIEL